MSRYKKMWMAPAEGLVVAIPALVSAGQDGHLSLQEWLTVLGLYLPVVVVALGPANKLTTEQLIDQAYADPKLDVVGKDYLGDKPKIITE